MLLKNTEIHDSWKCFLSDDILNLLKRIEAPILNGGPFTPPPERVLLFLRLDLTKIKIIILGQDPYPQPGVATGRAFEVHIKSWTEKFKQSSLRNILRAIHAAHNDCEPATLNAIRGVILSGVFNPPPPDKIFDHWERQGVLCLNTAFTCEEGSPGSHAALWAPFTESLIKFIAGENKNIIWFLWGNHARGYEKFLSGAKNYKCAHPMLPGTGENGFLNCPCFRETKAIVDWV